MVGRSVRNAIADLCSYYGAATGLVEEHHKQHRETNDFGPFHLPFSFPRAGNRMRRELFDLNN
jgi:hypothetical protein